MTTLTDGLLGGAIHTSRALRVIGDMVRLRLTAFHKLQPGGGIEEQIGDLHATPSGTGRGLDFQRSRCCRRLLKVRGIPAFRLCFTW